MACWWRLFGYISYISNLAAELVEGLFLKKKWDISYAFCKCPVFIFQIFILLCLYFLIFFFYFNHYKPSSRFIGKANNKNVQPLSQLESPALYIFSTGSCYN